MNMRICLISETLFPVSGTSSRTLNLARALTQRGHSVYVIAPKENPDAPLVQKYQGFRIQRLNIFMPQTYGARRRNAFFKFLIEGGPTRLLSEILKVSDQFKADVLHFVNYYMSLCGVAFRKFINSSVCDIQASAFLESQSALNKAITTCIEKSICDSGLPIIVPTDELRAYLTHRYPQCNSRTQVIPLCIDAKAFNEFADKNRLRKRLGLSEKEYLVVFHGSPYKSNIDALKKLNFVVNRLNARGLRVRGLILGIIGQFVNSPYFISQGYVEHLTPFISAADLAVLPVDAPSLGMRTRVLEYMACGIPVIVLSRGACGYREASKRNALVMAQDVYELIYLSLTLLLDPSLRREIATNALKYVKNHLSNRTIALKLESIYRELL